MTQQNNSNGLSNSALFFLFHFFQKNPCVWSRQVTVYFAGPIWELPEITPGLSLVRGMTRRHCWWPSRPTPRSTQAKTEADPRITWLERIAVPWVPIRGRRLSDSWPNTDETIQGNPRQTQGMSAGLTSLSTSVNTELARNSTLKIIK